MERDYGQELDQLKEQMEALRQEMATQVERLREEAQASLPNQPIMERLGRVEVPGKCTRTAASASRWRSCAAAQKPRASAAM